MVGINIKKKNFFYVIVLLLTLITMIIGLTFAYLKFIASQKKDSTILYTGTLQVNYIDGVYLKDPILYPKKNVNYDTYDDVYRNRFQVTSTGSLDQTISVDMIISRNDFAENALKYAIYNSFGILLDTGNISKSGNINLVDNVFLASNSSAVYTLIIWWDDTDYNQINEGGSVISGRIDVYAKQIVY